jgi:hypothetical protein
MKHLCYLPWVTYRGVWHIYKGGNSHSLCGAQIGSLRFADTPVSKLKRCPRCHEAMAAIVAKAAFCQVTVDTFEN